MPYFRVDDDFPQHPKVLAIPRRDRVATVGLWTMAGTWCSRNLTDGRLAKHMVSELGSSKKYADHLVRVGLWAEDEDSYVFHEFVSWQGASREEILAKREAEADRKRKWREAKAAKRAASDEPVPDMSQRDNPRTDNGTPTSVRPESEPRPLLPSPPHPSPPHVPYGDMRDGETQGGIGTEVDAHDRDAPPRCPQHIDLPAADVPNCKRCQRLRLQWETSRPADEVFQRPPWCGHCDEWTRKIEIQIDGRDAVRNCPTCHPIAHQESA